MGDFTCVKKTKSKAGKEFSAKLKLLHDGKVDFIFNKKKLAPRGAHYIGVAMRTSAELVEILDNFLQARNLSRRQFCILVDIPNSTVASWKSNNVSPSIELVAKVAKFMNVSLDWLIYGESIVEDKNNLEALSVSYNFDFVKLFSLTEEKQQLVRDLLKFLE